MATAFHSLVVLTLSVLGLVTAGHVDLQSKYPFSATLLSDASRGYYTLHWNFTRTESIIYFAVNVSTTGWVGFGLSPTGGMVNSDVVIGWVNNGAVYFKDRYADAQDIPPVDSSQDWCLTSAEQEGDYTILEFNRKFVTCDSRDRDITVDTARVVWSFNPQDPAGNNDVNLLRHTQRGAASLNLLGGNPQQTPAGSEQFLDVTVSNVRIPEDRTTYWCESYRLPQTLISTTHFVNRITPAITPHAREFVHHILVYLCPANSPLSPSEVGQSQHCHEAGSNVGNCLGNGVLIGGWAVGGDEFVYPEGIAFPVGGTGQEQFIVMQMHYDNPNQQTGVVDSSGLRFYYNTQEPTHRAGIMYLGLNVGRAMILPPGSSEFTLTSVCSANCTNAYIPQEGITIIGNLLHTHLVGRSVTVSHYHYNTTTNQLMELEPLDQNLNYDFNFQQFTHLPSPRVVKPGDILVMQCKYDTTSRSNITYGGEATTEEMCLSFPVFYPRPADGSAIVRCSSSADLSSILEFYGYIIGQNLTTSADLQADYFGVLESLDWIGDPMLSSTLQSSLSTGRASEICVTENSAFEQFNVAMPQPEVRFQPVDACVGVTSGQISPTCLKDGDAASKSGPSQSGPSGAIAPAVSASLVLVSVVAILLNIII